MIFRSERLSFRCIEMADIDELFKIWGDGETMCFCGGAVEKEKIHQMVEYTRTQYTTYGNAVFAVLNNGKFIGVCGGKLDDDNPLHVEIIIHLAKEYWHQGYASEALDAYIAWLKAGKKATYVYASIHPENKASINLAKKCGIPQNGYRQYQDTGFVDEPFFEMYLYY